MTGQERELIKNALKDWSQFKLKEQSISKEHPELIPILRKELNEIPEYESIGCLAKSIVFDIQLKRCKNCGKLITYKINARELFLDSSEKKIFKEPMQNAYFGNSRRQI